MDRPILPAASTVFADHRPLLPPFAHVRCGTHRPSASHHYRPLSPSDLHDSCDSRDSHDDELEELEDEVSLSPDLPLARLRLTSRSLSPEVKPKVSRGITLPTARPRLHAHRRAYSLTTPSSRPIVILPQPIPRVQCALAASPPMSIISRATTPSTPITPPRYTSPSSLPIPEIRLAPSSPSPARTKAAPSQKRMVLMTPAMAAHLQQGGSISVVRDGGKRFRIRLPVGMRQIVKA